MLIPLAQMFYVLANQNNSFQSGWDAAKERLSQSHMGMVIPAGTEIKNISGTIQKIDGNKLTLKINPLEPLSDPNLDTRIITVDSSTKIILAVQRDQALFQKEMQDFQDKMKQPPVQTDPSQLPTQILSPKSYDNRDINLADLKENQQIAVSANENIKDKQEFTAVQIDVQDAAPASGSVPVPAPPIVK